MTKLRENSNYIDYWIISAYIFVSTDSVYVTYYTDNIENYKRRHFKSIKNISYNISRYVCDQSTGIYKVSCLVPMPLYQNGMKYVIY
jgi:hypothetical protein